MLYKDTLIELQKKYLTVLNKALPGLKVEHSTIEVVDHGLANGEADDAFLNCGLGISVRQIYIRPESAIGYTGKILIWLPGQFMPEHRHRDIIAVPKEMLKSLNLPFKFVNMSEVVNDFNGVKGYDSKKYEFVVPTEDSILINFKDINNNVDKMNEVNNKATGSFFLNNQHRHQRLVIGCLVYRTRHLQEFQIHLLQ